MGLRTIADGRTSQAQHLTAVIAKLPTVRLEPNVVTQGAVPHCHHHGDTQPPQSTHIAATILATL